MTSTSQFLGLCVLELLGTQPSSNGMQAHVPESVALETELDREAKVGLRLRQVVDL